MINNNHEYKLSFYYVPKTVLHVLHGICILNLYYNPMRNVLFSVLETLFRKGNGFTQIQTTGK